MGVSTGLLGQGSQLKLLLVELEQVLASKSRSTFSVPLVIILAIPLLMLDGLLSSANTAEPPMMLYIKIGGEVLMVVTLNVLWTFDQQHLRRYQLGLYKLVRQAGLIERLALGPNALPDIYHYTMFPWSYLIGPRPVTFAQNAKLLAANLDWYLLPEPRPYFRGSWIMRFLMWLAPIGWWVWIIYRYFLLPVYPSTQQLPLSAPPPAAHLGLWHWEIMLESLLALILLLVWLHNHESKRLACCLEVLLIEVKQRLRKEIGVPLHLAE